MDSSKIISLEDLAKNENRYPSEEEALRWAIQLCDLVGGEGGNHPLLSPKNIYVENGNKWTTAHPPVTRDASEALFRMGAVLHYLLTRKHFQISHYLDGPPAIRERNPQISVRLESIVLRLLQNIRSLRYPSVQDLRDDLERLQKELSGDWTVHWACFKGNGARTNAISEASFDPSGKTLKEIWSADIGEIWASPVIAGEHVFVGSGDGSFYSIDTRTGKVIWKLSLGARIESTPCIDNHIAYLGNDVGALYAVNIKNGSILWKKSLGEYVRSSVYCDKTNLYVGSISATQKAGTLWSLSKGTGETVWKKGIAPIFSSPVVDREDIIVGTDDETLYCFSPSGSQKWKLGLAGKVRSTPVAFRDFVYAGGFGGVLYKIRRTTGEVVWRNSEAGSMYSSPAIARGFLAVGNNGGLVTLFQVSTGKKIAEFATGGPVTATPLIINKFILIGSNDGRFYILDALGKAVCSFDAQSPINSSGCYRDNMIYVGTDEGLLALGM